MCRYFLLLTLIVCLSPLVAKDLIVNGPLFVGNTSNNRFAIMKIETDFDSLKVSGNELYSFEKLSKGNYEVVTFTGHIKLNFSSSYGKYLLDFDAFPNKEYYLKLSKDVEKTYLVKVNANIDSAAVFVNNKLISFTPGLIELLPGKYTFRLEKNNYIPYENSFSVKNDTTLTINIEENYAWLDVRSIADSVYVFLNGKNLGFAPVKMKIPLKDYSLVLKRNSYYIFKHNFVAESGLVYPQIDDYGMIQFEIDCYPENSSIYIDDFYAGKSSGIFLINKGLHDIKVLSKNYHDFSYQEFFKEDTTKKIRLKKKLSL